MSAFNISQKDVLKAPRVLAITGGKGGVGKTSISVNLAIALSRNGSKVCLFDADTGLANINIMLGIHPAYTLEHLFSGEKSIQDIVVEGPANVQIVPGASGAAQCAELDAGQQQRLVSSLRSIEPHYDYMLVDTAAGISPTVLHFVAAAQVAVIVITPEPTSLTDAFSLLKVLRRRGYRRKVQVIVNMAPSSAHAEKVFRRFSHAVSKYLELVCDYLGPVWMDESMRTAVSLQRPVALFPKNDPSARSFYRLAERVDDLFSRPGVPKLAFSAYWSKVVERQRARLGNVEVDNVSRPDVVKPVPRRSAADTAAPASVSPGASLHRLDRSPPERLNEQVSAKRTAEEPREKAEAPRLGLVPTLPAADEQVERKQLADHLAQLSEKVDTTDQGSEAVGIADESTMHQAVPPDHDEPLTEGNEQQWQDLRRSLNDFITSADTTPEQVLNLLSSGIQNVGSKLGTAGVDLVFALLDGIGAETLDQHQKASLRQACERLGVFSEHASAEQSAQPDQQANLAPDEGSQAADANGEEADPGMARYDEAGFGCQNRLAKKIKAGADVPLEELLESIKYASLVDDSSQSS